MLVWDEKLLCFKGLMAVWQAKDRVTLLPVHDRLTVRRKTPKAHRAVPEKRESDCLTESNIGRGPEALSSFGSSVRPVPYVM